MFDIWIRYMNWLLIRIWISAVFIIYIIFMDKQFRCRVQLIFRFVVYRKLNYWKDWCLISMSINSIGCSLDINNNHCTKIIVKRFTLRVNIIVWIFDIKASRENRSKDIRNENTCAYTKRNFYNVYIVIFHHNITIQNEFNNRQSFLFLLRRDINPVNTYSIWLHSVRVHLYVLRISYTYTYSRKIHGFMRATN